jgi:hypothetical protein
MGRVVGPPLKEGDKEWILKQRLFFHATAPLSASHRVNVSPKCAREFRVIDDCTVAWLDLTGSGSETCAHLLENGRLIILFVALNGEPKIVRLHGTGRFILPRDFKRPEHGLVMSQFKSYLNSELGQGFGIRSIIVLDVDRVSQSCGYSIPIFDFVRDRATLDEVTSAKGCEGMKEYRRLKNSYSIDGLRSIAQLELEDTNTAPTAIENNHGYIYATEYGGSWWRQTWVRWTLGWQFNQIQFTAKDALVFACGAMVGSLGLALYWQRRLSR